MSSVLPIDTQHYQSGDYTLEVTAHPSPLSQWSDRPVVRQLRFNLWVEQPERKKLATGNQQQLITLSNAVESYVQANLTQQAWPQTHHLKLLGQDIELSTLQLFNLAETLNAYGQTTITLPAAPKQRRRTHWWTGSAAASLLVAVGVTSLYFQNRPAAWNDAVTSQAPEVALDNAGEDVAPTLEAEEEAISKATSGASSGAEVTVDRAGEAEQTARTSATSGALEQTQELPQQPSPPRANDRPQPADSRPPVVSLEPAPQPPPVDTAPPAAKPPAPQPAPLPEAASRIAPPPAEPSRAELDSIEENIEANPEDTGSVAIVEQEAPLRASERAATAEEPRQSQPRTRRPELREPLESASAPANDAGDRIVMDEPMGPMAAIATQLAPYQPTEAPYPLVYHLHIAADGTITAIEPITEGAPIFNGPNRVAAPGKPLKLELTYTGADQPVVNELLE